jgi:hypothetical protein
MEHVPCRGIEILRPAQKRGRMGACDSSRAGDWVKVTTSGTSAVTPWVHDAPALKTSSRYGSVCTKAIRVVCRSAARRRTPALVTPSRRAAPRRTSDSPVQLPRRRWRTCRTSLSPRVTRRAASLTLPATVERYPCFAIPVRGRAFLRAPPVPDSPAQPHPLPKSPRRRPPPRQRSRRGPPRLRPPLRPSR